MSASTVDRLLALIIALQLATGLVTLRTGAPAGAPLFVIHGMLGGSLALLAVVKLRRSFPNALRMPRWGRLALSGVVTLLAVAALGGGFAWVASGRILSIGPWTVLTLHVWAALALVPLLVVHLLPRRWRLLRPARRTPASASVAGAAHRLLTRRALLTSGALALAGGSAWLAANALDLLLGGGRRFTGSRPLPSGGVPPVTTFYGEPTPRIDGAGWRLAVRGAVARPLSFDLDELMALGTQELQATLDCTSGWAMTTRWRGVPMATVLEAAQVAPSARSVTIRSITGWATSLDLADARRSLLATGVAGQPLPAGNGAPCRLVAPDHRGLDWVKWVTDVEVA
jgi:DMSO/TMAO reductase YedYZ molybdopterin-dependent catalytic subunit